MKTVEDRLHEDETPLNPFLSNATFLYPLKTPEKPIFKRITPRRDDFSICLRQ